MVCIETEIPQLPSPWYEGQIGPSYWNTLVVGLGIGLINAPTRWNEPGQIATCVALCAATMSYMAPRAYLFIAAASGVWAVLLGWSATGVETLIAPVTAFIAAWVGSRAGELVGRNRQATTSEVDGSAG